MEGTELNGYQSSHHQADPWASLKSFTSARIALGRTGASVPLAESLNFKLAHAHARDAIYSSLDVTGITAALERFKYPVYSFNSCAADRQQYLQRPDLGRQLSQEAVTQLSAGEQGAYDVAIILADGLSATAVNKHAVPVLSLLIPLLQREKFSIAPFTLVAYGRVAVADQVGKLLGARLTVVLIGERPGLSSPHSMGAYLTYAPAPGLTDEARNCLSNIRPEGLVYEAAAHKLMYLIKESLRLQLSGVMLKDMSGALLDEGAKSSEK